MFTSLKIENFKAWRSTGELRLAPLTVLFGPNRAGKSSLTQFLLMLKQTIESSDPRVLHPGDRNTIVQLGTFRDLIFDHHPDGRLSFELSFSLPSRLTIGDPKSANPRRGDALRFSSNIRRYGVDGDRLRVESMKWLLTNLRNPQRCIQVPITPSDGNGEDYVEFSHNPALVDFDPADRKFVAVAVASAEPAPILQAVDRPWWHAREPLSEAGVAITFLCQEEIAQQRS